MKTIFILISCMLSLQLVHAQAPQLDQGKLLELYQTQRYAEAAQYLQNIYPANTTDIKALNQMAYCYMMANKLPDAEQRYLKINSIQPNTLPVLFNLANINARRGAQLKARAYLTQIVNIDSNNFSALKKLADLTTDSTELMLLYLKRANALNNTDPDVAFDLALAYKNLKDFGPAYQVLTLAIAADTSNLVLQQALLPIANQLEKYKEVINIGEKLLLNGGDANVVKDLAIAYFRLKNYQKCISLFKTLEDAALQNETITYYMALSYRELKDYDNATAYTIKTIDEGISPNTTNYYALLGDLYETNNKPASSAIAYKKGLTFKTNGTIYYRLGLLYDLKLNQKKTALNNYQLYLKSKPDPKKELQQIDYVKTRIAALQKTRVPQK